MASSKASDRWKDRRKSKNIIDIRSPKARDKYEAKTKQSERAAASSALKNKTPVAKQKDAGTDMGNMIKNSVKSVVPGAALEAGLRLKNLKDTAKPQKLSKKPSEDKKPRPTKKGK